MLRSTKEMEGYAVDATDGTIGHVNDFYLDDESWVIRYLVVETGGWLSSRKVLVSPISIGTPNEEQRMLPASISRAQVRASPDIDTDQPVSRQHEMTYSYYYDYSYYWGGANYWGSGLYPNLLMPGYGGLGGALANRDERRRKMTRCESKRHEENDLHLRSCNAVIGYCIDASDGEVGHVAGLLIDEDTWAIRYFVVDTGHWWLGHTVLIAPHWIKSVDWYDRAATVSITRQAVKDAPAYDPQRAPNRHDRDRLDRLDRHYKPADIAGLSGPA